MGDKTNSPVDSTWFELINLGATSNAVNEKKTLAYPYPVNKFQIWAELKGYDQQNCDILIRQNGNLTNKTHNIWFNQPEK